LTQHTAAAPDRTADGYPSCGCRLRVTLHPKEAASLFFLEKRLL
jgi:hypothetical protein